MIKKFGFFDTHFHLFDERYKKETKYSEDEIIKKSFENGVQWICNVGTTFEDSKIVVKQIQKYKNIIGAVGCHPNYSDNWNEKSYEEFQKLLKNDKIKAIGEIGLDYYRKFTTKNQQKKCFEDQLILSKKHKLPVLLHLRDSYEDALKIIEKLNIKKGIVHCFSGTLEQAEKFIKLGFLISISGIITFSNAKKLHEIVKIIPLEKIVVETDAPYLTPIPFRGRVNYSEYIKFTIKKISDIKNISFDKVVFKTTENALNLFGLN